MKDIDDWNIFSLENNGKSEKERLKIEDEISRILYHKKSQSSLISKILYLLLNKIREFSIN